MRVAYEYSHLGGKEILQVRFPEILREIREVIAEVKAKRAKVSKEKNEGGHPLVRTRTDERRLHGSLCEKGISSCARYLRHRASGAGKTCGAGSLGRVKMYV
jgi:hypothetical protein